MINVKMQQSDNTNSLSPKITVIGVGGAGGNAVNNMIASNLEGCEFLVCNTDAQALTHSLCQNKIQLGETVTGGLGAGSKPEIGKSSAEETLDEVIEYLDGSNMVFVTAGMGGGTGTGAAPVIAKACRERGILTVGVVTKPFHFEGSHRMRMAEEGLKEMQSYVDTLIVIPNQNLFRIANEKTTFADGFKMADSVLQSGVRGVTDLMVRPGLVNLDFADIRTAMLEMGKAMMGTGEAEGEKRAIEAAEAAINNPLLDDVTMKGARGVIINVTGGYDMTLFEADEACNRIRDEVDANANIIFGATFDEKMEGKMRVSIVATGIEREQMRSSDDNGSTTSAPQTETSESERVYKTGIDNLRGITAPISPAESLKESIENNHKETMEETAPAMPTMPAMPEKASAPATQQESLIDQLVEESKPAMSEAQPETKDEPSLRGTRYKNAFIPPQPVMAGGMPKAPLTMPGAAQAEQMEMPKAPSAAMPQQNASGLVLNPPKKQMQPSAEKKQSFFEKIAGTVQQHLSHGMAPEHHDMQEQRPAPQSRAMSSPSLGSAATAQTAPSPAQGQLNIDTPAAAPKGDSDLDIPAFLRRQAN